MFIYSCEEVPTELPTNVNNGRKVVMEEFTGVRCVACPAGSKEIENLLDFYGEQLIAVSIHSGFFANPLPANNYDFKIPAGEQLDDFLGPVSGWPRATVNRFAFAGEPELPVAATTWAGYIQQLLAQPPRVLLDITNAFDEGSRELDIVVEVTAQDQIDESLNITVMVLETNIKDAQLTPETTQQEPDTAYIHRHVLREVVTNVTGDEISTGWSLGQTTNYSFSTTIDANWVSDNCSVVAFLHHRGGSGTKEVLQGAQKHL